jgi:hypothetical protein
MAGGVDAVLGAQEAAEQSWILVSSHNKTI